MKVLQNYVGNKAAAHDRRYKDPVGVNFYQSEEVQVRGTNGKLHVSMKCGKYKKLGHCKIHCPEDESDKEGEEEEGKGIRHFHAQDPACLIDYYGDDDLGLCQRL